MLKNDIYSSKPIIRIRNKFFVALFHPKTSSNLTQFKQHLFEIHVLSLPSIDIVYLNLLFQHFTTL